MEKCPIGSDPVEEYLIHSYLYYNLDESIIPDYQYDMLCKWMLDHYDTLEHEYMHLVDEDSLRAGTGHHLMFLFPQKIKDAAYKRLEAYNVGES